MSTKEQCTDRMFEFFSQLLCMNYLLGMTRFHHHACPAVDGVERCHQDTIVKRFGMEWTIPVKDSGWDTWDAKQFAVGE